MTFTGACPCCGKGAIVPEVQAALVRLDSLVGNRLRLLSGYRCAGHNRDVGGSPRSQHLVGLAADVTCPDCDVQTLASLAESIDVFRVGGIGMYPAKHFVHVDGRAGAARWVL